MAKLSELPPIKWVLRKSVGVFVSLLTKPVSGYTLTIANDMLMLKRHIRKGDVLLVEGNERISECIKYLTQSSWSHSAIYVGDEPLKRDPELKRRLTAEYGEEANYLLVEALVESGVIVTPLCKYRDFNIRLCRPYNLTTADQREVVDHAVSLVGRSYDLKNIIDLARYFLPVSMVPLRLRRHALQFGSGDPTRVICSSLIAECFQRVRFPIAPRFEPMPDGTAPASGKRWLRRFSRRATPLPVLLRTVSPSLITPRDFDLSPYFEIIKFNIIENSRFDYHQLRWADDEDQGGPEFEKSA